MTSLSPGSSWQVFRELSSTPSSPPPPKNQQPTKFLLGIRRRLTLVVTWRHYFQQFPRNNLNRSISEVLDLYSSRELWHCTWKITMICLTSINWTIISCIHMTKSSPVAITANKITIKNLNHIIKVKILNSISIQNNYYVSINFQP